MPPSIGQPESLEDGRVCLRPLAERDFTPWVDAFREDPGLGVMLGSEQDPSLDEMPARLNGGAERLADGKGAEFVVADAGTDDFLGAVNLFALDWHSRRGEVGIWLRRPARGRGLASAALTLMLGWAFDSLELERVEMTTIPDNEQLPRLAERLGFAHEGVLRARNLERGRRVDIIFYGLLRREWAAQPDRKI